MAVTMQHFQAHGDHHFLSLTCFNTTVLLALLLFVTYALIAKTLRRMHYHEHLVSSAYPPGSRGLPLIGETLQFMAAINSGKGFYEFVRERRIRYGRCFRTNIFGETHVFVASTESAKEILNNDLGKFSKRYISSIAELVGNESVLCACVEHHRLIRNRLASFFSASSLRHFVEQFDCLIVDSFRSWENRGAVVVLSEAYTITLKAMCKMLMSFEGEDELIMLQKDVDLVCGAMLAFPSKLPWTRFHKGLKARKRIMSLLEKKITERRSCLETDVHLPHYPDFLQHLIKNNHDPNTPSLTDPQIKDNILTMIIAGQDTTASAMTWMVKFLDENQEVLNELKEEAVRFQASSIKGYLSIDVFNEMPYASKVVKESLRMASIVPWFPRLALEDSLIHGYKIRKGWYVNIDAKSIHLDPTMNDEPESFMPARFNDESKPYSFLAFGAGGRTCLGMNMAKSMMLVFLHRLVTTYKWEVIDSDLSIEKWTLFSRLKSGCPIRVMRVVDE